MRKIMIFLFSLTLIYACKKENDMDESGSQRVYYISKEPVWGGNTRTDEFTYDKNGRITSVKIYDYNAQIDAIKIVYEPDKVVMTDYYMEMMVNRHELYFEGNKKIVDISYVSAQGYALKKVYHYNALSDIDSIMWYYEGSSGYFLSYREAFVYKNNMLEYILGSWNTPDGWLDNEKIQFIYLDTTLMTVEKMKRNGEDSWGAIETRSYKYDENNLVSVNYDFTLEWEVDDSTTYTYNDQGNCTLITGNLDKTVYKYQPGVGNYEQLFRNPEDKYYRKLTIQ